MIILIRTMTRSKGRVFISTLGIGCCMSLVLSSVGLVNAATGVEYSQYGKNDIFKYDTRIVLRTAQDGNQSEILDKVVDDQRTEHSMLFEIMSVSGTVNADRTGSVDGIKLVVPQDESRIADFVNLKTIKGSNSLAEGCTVVTKKFADDLSLDIGDTVFFSDFSDLMHQAKITGIVENYIGHYAYMSPKTFEHIFTTIPQYKYILSTMKDYVGEKNVDEFVSIFLKEDIVLSVSTANEISKSEGMPINRVIAVVLLFVGAACLLALIVMYTVSNVNISERTREIANIKVLGFSDHEVLLYVLRENVVSTFWGIVVGIVGGIVMNKTLIGFISVDNISYDIGIKWWSYIVSALIIVAVSCLASLPIKLKTDRINMAETLKDIE